MNKIILACALFSLNVGIYAADTTINSTTSTTVTPVAPVTNVAAPATHKAPAPKKAPEQKPSSNNNGSVYESIRSGWNSFIDLLAPPNK